MNASEGLLILSGLLGGNYARGSARPVHEVRFHRREGWPALWIPVDQHQRFAKVLEWLGDETDVLVSAVPRYEQRPAAVGDAWCVWTQGSGSDFERRLEAMRPVPSIVLREGATSRRTAFWALRRPLDQWWSQRANRRVCHALGAPKTSADGKFLFHAPGSCLRDGRSRPVPIVVDHLDVSAVYTPRDVVAHLPEAPDPNAWRKQQKGRAQGPAPEVPPDRQVNKEVAQA